MAFKFKPNGMRLFATYLNMSQRRAFTLVELLVVISIIGLLSTIAVVNLGSARSKARNAKRIGDIRQLVTAFSLGYDTVGSYPTSGGVCISTSCYEGYTGMPVDNNVINFFKPYTPVPSDPVGGRGYGGYVYIGNFAGDNGTDGYFPPGPVLDWFLEGIATCGIGRRYTQITTRTECVYNLVQ
jgi:prepilin-type N-terminal cleavage/methylation domain-containing protein